MSEKRNVNARTWPLIVRIDPQAHYLLELYMEQLQMDLDLTVEWVIRGFATEMQFEESRFALAMGGRQEL